ncbi:MAG: hypothetical protein Fur005_45920 [Roseiflexaceae bacterium]
MQRLMIRTLIALLLIAMIGLITTPSRAATPDIHLTLGNPSGATNDLSQEQNFLISRTQYTLAYQRADGIPRWVSWYLTANDIGPAPRCDCFTSDTSLPVGWNRIVTSDYTNSGYDRGHMTASEDRTANDAENAATFIMTNLLPQSPQNNRGPWARLESTSRSLAQTGNELYIISGPAGTLGTLASGTLRIPAATWKAVLVLPEGSDDLSRITTATRVIAIRISNDKNDTSVQQSDPWEQYRTSVDTIEAETGDDLFNALPPRIQRVIEARVDTGPQALNLTIVAGNNQSTLRGSTFPQQLTIEVHDASNQPQAGVPVVFASLGTGADALFAAGDTQITIITDSQGRASVPATASAIAGSYTVEASTAGVYTPLVFQLTNSDDFVIALPLVIQP